MWAFVNSVHSQPDFLADILSDLVLLSGPGKEEEKKGKSECNDSVWHAWALTSCYGVHLKPRTIIMPQELVTQYHIFTSTAACHTHTALCCDYCPLLADRATHRCVFTLSHYAALYVFNWAHFHPSWVQAMYLAKHIFCYLHWKLCQIWGQIPWGE